MALSNTFLWDFFYVFVCQTFLLEQRGQLNQTAGQHHAATVIIGEVFPFQNASYISESGNKGRRRSRERERERTSDRDYTIDLSLLQLAQLSFSHWVCGGRRWDAAPQVSNSKAELKQRFLIRPEKVESKTMSLVHVVRIREDELPQEW